MSTREHPEQPGDARRPDPDRAAAGDAADDEPDDDGCTPQPDERQPFTPIVLAIAFLLALALALWSGGARADTTVLEGGPAGAVRTHGCGAPAVPETLHAPRH